MDAFLAIFFSSFAPVLGTLMTGLISWAAVEITKYVRTKTKNDTANDAISHICHTVSTTVAELNQTMVPAMQKAAADGKLTSSDAAMLKRLAEQKINSQIPAAISTAAKLAISSISNLIDGKIEQAVADQKGQKIES